MRDHNMHLAEYLQLFEAQQNSSQVMDILETRDSSCTISTFWDLSFQHLQQQEPLSFRCLAFLICIAAHDIPGSLMLPGEPLLMRTKAIGVLIEYGFLERSREPNLFHVRPLIHEAARRWCRREDKWANYVFNALMNLVRVVPCRSHESSEQSRVYLRHGLRLLGHFEFPSLRDFNNLVHRVATYQIELGDHAAAGQSLRKLLPWNHSPYAQPALNRQKRAADVAFGDSALQTEPQQTRPKVLNDGSYGLHHPSLQMPSDPDILSSGEPTETDQESLDRGYRSCLSAWRDVLRMCGKTLVEIDCDRILRIKSHDFRGELQALLIRNPEAQARKIIKAIMPALRRCDSFIRNVVQMMNDEIDASIMGGLLCKVVEVSDRDRS